MHIPRIRPRPKLIAGPTRAQPDFTMPEHDRLHAPHLHAKLPRDACVTITTDPPELYISLTIRKPEHLQALLDAVAAFAPMLDTELE